MSPSINGRMHLQSEYSSPLHFWKMSPHNCLNTVCFWENRYKNDGTDHSDHSKRFVAYWELICRPLTIKTVSCSLLRLESQMISDIQAILQLLQRQTTTGPPAYSTVTSSPEYQKPAIRVHPGSALPADLSLAPAPSRSQVQVGGQGYT